jgi:predicted amidohydrolase
MFTQVCVAACSFKPRKFDVSTNSDRLESLFRRAAASGAELAVAPEGALDGYVVMSIIEGSQPVERMYEAAVSLDGPEIRRFLDLARELRMCMLFGLAQRLGTDVYNCAIYIDSLGQICGTYHKMQLAEGYHDSWWFNRLGSRSRAFPTPFGKCGVLICNDRWNADIARISVLDGARYMLIPSYGSRSRNQDRAVLARARENGIPIVEANVGVTLIVSKGEVVACERRVNALTMAVIEVPAAPSTSHRDQHEHDFLRWREEEMLTRYKHGEAIRRTGIEHRADHDSQGRLVVVE